MNFSATSVGVVRIVEGGGRERGAKWRAESMKGREQLFTIACLS